MSNCNPVPKYGRVSTSFIICVKRSKDLYEDCQVRRTGKEGYENMDVIPAPALKQTPVPE